MKQLSLFDDNQPLEDIPLPRIVARRWEFPLAWHDAEACEMYAVQDWIAGLASCGTTQAARLWKDMQGKTTDRIVSLPYVATDGKTYRRAYTDDEGLYKIAAHMRATKSRPVLAEIKDYLARAGAFVDHQRIDPEIGVQAALGKYERQGKDPAWIEARAQGIVARKQFTEALKSAIADMPEYLYSAATEAIYIHLLERTTKQLRADLNLNRSQNVRDHMGKYALIYLRLAESIAATKLDDVETVSEALGFEIIRSVAMMIHDQYQATQSYLKMDLVTERKLLEGKP